MTLKKPYKKILMVLTVGLTLLNTTPILASKPKENSTKLKNVILLIGDGMGYNQLLAAKCYNHKGTNFEIYDKFKTRLSMSTYKVDGYYDQSLWNDFNDFMINPTDSAAASTAMSTGTKTFKGQIGIDKDKNKLKHIIVDFKEKGKSTGIVTSVPISHATPAGFSAHNENRNNYAEIANEILKESKLSVLMGAGHPHYDDNGEKYDDSKRYNYQYVGGKETWKKLKNGTLEVADINNDKESDSWTLIETKKEFEKLTRGKTPDRVVGVCEVASTLQQKRFGDENEKPYEVEFNKDVPTLETMTKSALNVLDNNEEGFFLMVESGAIDWAGHNNQKSRLIEEVNGFTDCVEAAFQWVEKNSNWSETLLIVTADHECGYLTGEKYKYTNVKNNGDGEMPTMFFNSNDHTNQLVPFYVKGRGEELFKKMADEQDKYRGHYLDNTEISKVIRVLLK